MYLIVVVEMGRSGWLLSLLLLQADIVVVMPLCAVDGCPRPCHTSVCCRWSSPLCLCVLQTGVVVMPLRAAGRRRCHASACCRRASSSSCLCVLQAIIIVINIPLAIHWCHRRRHRASVCCRPSSSSTMFHGSSGVRGVSSLSCLCVLQAGHHHCASAICRQASSSMFGGLSAVDRCLGHRRATLACPGRHLRCCCWWPWSRRTVLAVNVLLLQPSSSCHTGMFRVVVVDAAADGSCHVASWVCGHHVRAGDAGQMCIQKTCNSS